MADAKIPLPSLHKSVLVTIPDGPGLTEAFKAASQFVGVLEANNKIRDLEAGLNPPGATHEIVKEKGEYRLRRFRFGAV